MKIGLFTDPHYCKADDLGLNRRPVFSLGKIKEAMEAFSRQGVEICFCLGDLVDRAKGDTKNDVLENLRSVWDLISSFEIPFYLVPGNHDFVDLTRKDFKQMGISLPDSAVSSVETDECKFVMIDANVRSSGRHFDEEGHVWDDANLTNQSVNTLAKELASAENKRCMVLVHENLDPTVQEQHIIKNAEEIRRVIKESGAVNTVIQGHYHEGSDYDEESVHYHALPAMCIGESNYFEIMEI